MLAVGGCQIPQLDSRTQDRLPLQVESAADLARRTVPGWVRAEAADLIVPLDITQPVPGTAATVTWEQAWYSGRQYYLLYTVKAPAGEHVLPTMLLLREDQPGGRGSSGKFDAHRLHNWGGFSSLGYHGVVAFPRFDPPPQGDHLKLEARRWTPVASDVGLSDRLHPSARELVALLPWRHEFLSEPPPEVEVVTKQETWLGRTLALERLEVGIGEIRLTGWVQLPAGEADPVMTATLRLGDTKRVLQEFAAVPGEQAGRYRFTARFDGSDTWPVPVQLELQSIGFGTDQTLEWSIPWARNRDVTDLERRLLDRADQASVQFYDSILRTITVWNEGIAVEHVTPRTRPPYVWAVLSISGRLHGTGPGMELAGPQGEVVYDLGGGGGVIWDDRLAGNRHGVSVNWQGDLPPALQQADRLTLRYVFPSAALVLDETWTLRG